MKAYTDLEQSRKLAEILSLESADMCYKCIEDDPYDIVCKPYSSWKEEYKGLLVRGDANVIPCWSLAALLNILAKESPIIKVSKRNGEYQYNIDIPSRHCKIWFSSILDAVFEMIYWLIG